MIDALNSPGFVALANVCSIFWTVWTIWAIRELRRRPRPTRKTDFDALQEQLNAATQQRPR